MMAAGWIVVVAIAVFGVVGLTVALAKLEDHEPDYELEEWVGDLLEERREGDDD